MPGQVHSLKRERGKSDRKRLLASADWAGGSGFLFYFIFYFLVFIPRKKNKNVWAVALIDSAPVGWPGGLAAR